MARPEASLDCRQGLIRLMLVRQRVAPRPGKIWIWIWIVTQTQPQRPGVLKTSTSVPKRKPATGPLSHHARMQSDNNVRKQKRIQQQTHAHTRASHNIAAWHTPDWGTGQHGRGQTVQVTVHQHVPKLHVRKVNRASCSRATPGSVAGTQTPQEDTADGT